MAVIEPNKCIIEDLEILAFESEEQLNFYTIWHEALVDKRRELNAVSDRERQIIRNEIARKTRQLISRVGGDDDVVLKSVSGSRKVGKTNVTPNSSSRRTTASKTGVVKITNRRSPAKSAATIASSLDIPTTSSARRAPSNSNSALAASRRAIAAAVAFRPTTSGSAKRTAQNQSFIQQPIGQRLSPTLPNGLTILNSSYFNTLPNGKQMMKYKLTKLYNKYRGRQVRRNLVNDKQRNARIEVEINKSYLNSWLTYTALQALRLPESNINSLNATTINSSQILTPFAQTNHQYTTPSPMPVCLPPQTPQTPSPAPKKKTKSLSKKQQKLLQQQQQPQQQQHNISNPQQQQHQQQHQFPQKPPLHLVYIDPGNIITYSNRINPQQVAEYKQKSHLLPSSATSKKSSAASYDVFEIMEVLANTNKTNVTITRNANRPAVAAAAAAAAAGGSQNFTSSVASSSATTAGSIYSHSVNANTPGIVSTQLHLQARSYIDIMSKLYAEEIKLLEEEKKSMLHEPSTDEIVRKYLNVDYNIENSFDSTRSQGSLNSNENCSMDSAEYQLICSSDVVSGSLSEQEDELEMLEEDIKSMLNVNKTTHATTASTNGCGKSNIININGSGDQKQNQMNELRTPLTQEML